MAVKFTDEANIAYKIQVLAREEQIKKLLGDILMDITICKLEGWDWQGF